MFGNFFRNSCLAWDNREKCLTDGHVTDYNIIGRMRIACWIPRTSNTQNTWYSCFSSTTVVTRTRLSLTLYVHEPFDIRMSVNLNIIPNYSQQDATFLDLFISTDDLHVSGGSSAHHLEHITVHTASGIVNHYCC